MDGDSHWFAPDGNAVKRSQFRDDQLEGITVEYYPGGKPRIKSEYKRNKLDGEMVEYAEDGQIKGRTLYEAGKPVDLKTQFEKWKQKYRIPDPKTSNVRSNSAGKRAG